MRRTNLAAIAVLMLTLLMAMPAGAWAEDSTTQVATQSSSSSSSDISTVAGSTVSDSSSSGSSDGSTSSSSSSDGGSSDGGSSTGGSSGNDTSSGDGTGSTSGDPRGCVVDCDEPCTVDCSPLDDGITGTLGDSADPEVPAGGPVAGRGALPFTGIGDVIMPILMSMVALLGGLLFYRHAAGRDAIDMAQAHAAEQGRMRETCSGYRDATRQVSAGTRRGEDRRRTSAA